VAIKAYGVLADSSVQPPGAPTGLFVIDQSASELDVGWTDVPSAIQYQVYLNAAPFGLPVLTSLISVTGLTPGTPYTFNVQAFNVGGASALSAPLVASTDPNTAPVWDVPAQVGNVGQAYFLDLNLVCTDIDQGQARTYSVISNNVPGVGLSSNGQAINGAFTTVGNYSMTVRANDGFDNSDVVISFTVSDPDVIAPTTAVLGTVTASGSTVTVPLTTPATDASGIASYQIARSDNGGTFLTRQAAYTGTWPYIETGVPDGSYTYKTRAKDASANANVGVYSAISNAVVVSSVPSTPDIPVFSAAPLNNTANRLTFSAGPNGAVPDDFDIDFSMNGNSGTGVGSGPWTAIAVNLGSSPKDHTGLTQGVRVYYRCVAKKVAIFGPYAFDSSVPGSRILYAAADYSSGRFTEQSGSRTNLTARFGNAIFLKAAAQVQPANQSTLYGATGGLTPAGAFNATEQGGSEAYDLYLTSGETVTFNGVSDVIAPREIGYFLRSMCYSGAPPITGQARSMGPTRHYEPLNIQPAPGEDPFDMAHDGTKCKPRTEFAWGKEDQVGAAWDTRFFFGFSVYLHRNHQADNPLDGHGSGPQILENNLKGSATSTSMSMHLIRPDPGLNYFNAQTGNPITAAEVGADLWWCLHVDWSTTGIVQGLHERRIAMAPVQALAVAGSDRGKWTDFIFELCYNPYTTAQANVNGWKFRANTGLVRVWKSSGTVPGTPHYQGGNGNRTISPTPIFEQTGPIGMKPRNSNDMAAIGMRHYCYWIRSDGPGGVTVDHPIYMGHAAMRYGYAENIVHPGSAVHSNMVTQYQSGLVTGFDDVTPRAG